MQIAFCHENVLPARGGAEMYVADLARRLAAAGHDIHLYACRWDPAALPPSVNVHPLDPVFRLAQEHGIVLLNGNGFAAPDWSVRVSFANLPDHVYDDIGRAVRSISRSYREAYEATLEPTPV